MYHSSISIQELLLFGALASCNYAGAFTLQTKYDACNFFDTFDFKDAAGYALYDGDPTNGSVNYLNRTEATSSGLINTNNNQVYIGVESTNIARLRGQSKTIHGRSSVRLESQATWGPGIMIADIEHMPGVACGIWPSLWSYNFAENPVGEIDIIEGINIDDSNTVSLHTCGGCSFTNIGGSNERPMCDNGGTRSKQCEDGKDNPDGCGNTQDPGSYGPSFNADRGGVFATWLSSSALRIYWFSRDRIPADITAGNPDPSQWGAPASQFVSGSGCNVAAYFKNQTIIIDTDFCGENINDEIWGQSCLASTGAQTCDDWVANHPEAFREAYRLFNSIEVYV